MQSKKKATKKATKNKAKKKKKAVKKIQAAQTIGRPSTFNEQIKHVIINLYKEGKTNQQVADCIGVHRRTLDFWKAKDAEFLRTINDIKDLPDKLIEATLFQKASGYSHKEEKVFCSEGQIITHDTIKQYPPDTASMIFWLKNRQPKRWREKMESERDIVAVTVNVEQTDLEDRIKLLED